MKKLKLISIILCVTMCLALLAGCASGTASSSQAPAQSSSQSESQSESQSSSQSEANTGDDKDTIVVATNAAFPPYEFYENEQAVGIDMDIMRAICDKLGYKMEVSDMEFGSIIIAVSSGKADVGAAGITVTEDRKKSVDFTSGYTTAVQAVIVTEDTSISSIDDLAGDNIKIGVQQDTTGDIYATDDYGEDHIVRFNKGADAVQALITGKVDAVIIDNSPAETFVSQNEGLMLLPTAYAEEEYAFVIAKDNTEFYNKVNGALEELIADGTVQKIIDTYISAD